MVHWKARKQALQYLKGSQDYGLIYNTPNSTSGLQIYADADGMSLNNRKVVSGYAFILNGTAVSWLSKQQEIVSLSTTEAEYIVLTYAAKETIWFCNFLSKLISPITFLFSIYNNNQSAISLAHAELSQFHARTKHINIQYYFIHEKIRDGLLNITYCLTNKMAADIFTKPLSSYKFKPLICILGLTLA